MDSLENYRILLAVADHEGFSAAAGALGLTTAKVSRSVAETEELLGEKLLQRTTRRVSVTEAGQRFISRVRPALAALEDATKARSESRHSNDISSLRISCCRAGGLGLVAPALAPFISEHPRAAVTLDLHDRPVQPENEGYDLAIAITEQPDDAETPCRRVLPIDLAIVASPTYCAMHKRPHSPSELLQHRLLVWSGMPTWHMRGDAPLKSNPPYNSNDLNVIQKCCAAASGVALLPVFMVAEQLRDHMLVQLLDGFEPKPLQLVAKWGQRPEPCSAAQLFLDHLSRYFRTHPI